MSHTSARLGSLLGLCLLSCPVLADTLHVDAALVTGANDGTSWADAFQGSDGLQAALAAAVANDRIFVAGGTYLPSSTGSRGASFQLINNVEVFGSFLGGETAPEQRPAFDVAPSILSGDLNGDDGSASFLDNSFHVVRGTSTNASAVLDGFHVVSGTASGGGANNDRGAGILCAGASSPTVRHCRFLANRCTFGGAAGYVNNGGAPSFTDCTFEDGDGGSFGGAFDIAGGGAVRYERCLFVNNTAGRGGALEIFATNGVVVNNCVFRGNVSTDSAAGGGAIWIGQNGNTQVRNCTIIANTATNHPAGGIRVQSAPNATVVNCILWDNVGQGGVQDATANVNNAADVTYSNVEFGTAGTGNISANPLFVDLAGGDYRLGAFSPAIDAGNNAAVPGGTTADFGGGARLVDDPLTLDTGSGVAPLIDMGAFEYGSGPSSQVVRNGTPANPDAFLPDPTSGPAIGDDWDPSIDHTTFVTDSITDFVLITGGPLEVPLGASGTLLCSTLAPPFALFGAPAPGAPFGVPIPNNLPLVGLSLCTQGGSIDSSFGSHLANAIDIVIGSF